MRRLPVILLLILSLVAGGCRRTPKYVIGKTTMSELLADLHVAEIVVDMNHTDFRTDSAKIALRQAIYDRHGVTQEQFDTSLVWYGHNIDMYIDVYADAVKILHQRDMELGNAIVEASRSISGDSVDIWGSARYARINKRMPSNLLTFDIEQDENWQPGDIYTWRIKCLDDGPRTVRWNILAMYSDSTIEWINTPTSTSPWSEMTFATDSTKSLTHLSGMVEILSHSQRLDQNNKKDKIQDIWIDSISLVRKRANPDAEISRLRTRINSAKML